MKKILIRLAIVIFIIIALVITFDKVYMPWLVTSEKVTVPNTVGMNKDSAAAFLQTFKLQPKLDGPKFDQTNPRPEDEVMFQNPKPGAVVKENRRVYLYYSGGEPKVSMPDLIGKTIRDANIIIKRFDLKPGKINEIRHEWESGTIVKQEYKPGTKLNKDETVNFTVSVGPKLGHIRTPALIGLSVKQAERKLRENSLSIGRKRFEKSPNALINTVIDQDPVQGRLIAVGDSVNLVITK